MAIKKRTRTFSGDVAATVGLGGGGSQNYGELLRVDVVSSVDTTVAVTIADADGVNCYTLASGDHTTKKRQYVTPIETSVVDTGGDPMIDAEGPGVGVIVRGPLTITPSGLGSGTLTVDVFTRV